MFEYLLKHHEQEILTILKDEVVYKHFSINMSFIQLFENNPSLGNLILKDPDDTFQKLNEHISEVQKHLIVNNDKKEINYNLIYKPYVHVRVYALPICPKLNRIIFPSNDEVGMFIQISGTVVRMTLVKMLENERKYFCAKCKNTVTVHADYEQYNVIAPVKRCPKEECSSTAIVKTSEISSESCKDYQEIKIQEQLSKHSIRTIPNTLWVTLDHDLVDKCKPGDDVTVTGILKKRWKPPVVGKLVDVDLAFKANHIQVNNDYGSVALITPETKEKFTTFWDQYSQNPLEGRDLILKSFCPQIYGLYLVKLATAVVLAGGSQTDVKKDTGEHTRAEPHLLLVGDPGTGKSQILKFASKVIARSVLTTGIGSTSAGLTVAAVMEDGEWHLEGGALVIADGGICCIDEFGTIKENDKTSIHEAMEQQTISVAKAGVVCKLNTRCTILAATNFKCQLKPSQSINMGIALASPLLSRFDLIIILKDAVDFEWDSLVANYILDGHKNKSSKKAHWNLETLQAYFSVIKKLSPVRTKNANKIITAYYQKQRKSASRDKARTTVRLLDSLIRIAEGHAKLLFRNSVEVMDAIMAVVLVELSMQGAGILSLDMDVHSFFPDGPMNQYVKLAQNVLTKLELPQILNEENNYLKELSISSFTSDCSSQRSHITETPSTPCNSLSIVEEKKDIKLETENDPKKRKISPTTNTPKINFKKLKSHSIMSDIELIKKIPSVSRIFDSNLDEEINLFDDEPAVEEKENCNIDEEVIASKTNMKENTPATSSKIDSSNENIFANFRMSQNSKLKLIREKFSFRKSDTTAEKKELTSATNHIQTVKDTTSSIANETKLKKSISFSSSQGSIISQKSPFESNDELDNLDLD